MAEIIHIAFLLIVINFYLRFRVPVLQASEKFMVSLMSIFLLFFLLYIIAYFFSGYFDQHKQNKLMSPMFMNGVFFVMNFILPIITTEVILAVYSRFRRET